MSSSRRFKITGVACAALVGISGFSAPAISAPFASVGASQVTAEPVVEQVQNRRTRPVARARARNNNNAAVGAAILGIGVLGIAAAAAASQQRRERAPVYYTDQWGNPVDAYGRPVYSRPVQSYGYYQQPGYYQPPAYGGGYYETRRPSRWERDQIRAQQREQIRQAQRLERQELRRREQWQYRQHNRGEFHGGTPSRPVDPFR